MEKLTEQDITFIDNYLLKSEVVYKDIRIEMTDHMATAVEQRMTENNEAFYEAFKAYMVENKKELLKSEPVYVKNIRKQLLKDFIKYFFSLKALIIVLLTFTIHFAFLSKFQLHNYKWFFFIYFITIYTLFGLYYTVKYKPFKEKFSVMGIMFSSHLLIWLPWHSIASKFYEIASNNKIYMAYTIVTLILFAYWQTAGKYIKQYRENYKLI